MRTLAALMLSVSLASPGFAWDSSGKESWDSSSKEGIEAVSRADYQRAETSFRKSLQLAARPHESAIAAGNIGVVLHRMGRDTEAITWLEHALESWKEPALAAQLAILERLAGEYVRADRVARAALVSGPTDPEARATLLNLVADILREQAQDSEARAWFTQALNVKGASWRGRVESLAGLGSLNRDPAVWREAIQLAHDHNDPMLEGVCVRGLGETQLVLNNAARAEPLLRQALAMFEGSGDTASHQVASTLSALGELYIGEDKPALAEEVLLHALEMDRKALGPRHPQIAMILQMLGDAAARLDRIDRARGYLTEASLIMTARFGENSAVAGVVLVNLGTIEQRSGHPAEAAVAYQGALAILRSSGPGFEQIRVTVTERCAQTLKAAHRGPEAKAMMAQAKAFRRN